MDTEKYLIANTTKEERIALIRSWVPDDEAMEDCDIDLWDMYADYINGKKEISECNAAFTPDYIGEDEQSDPLLQAFSNCPMEINDLYSPIG